MVVDIDKIRRKNRHLGILLWSLAVIVAAAIALPSPDGTEARIQDAPKGIKLRSIELMPYDRSAAYDDPSAKPYVLLEFFTPQCRFCRLSVPELNRLNRSRDIAVVAYTSGGAKPVKTFMRTEGVDYPVSRTSAAYAALFNPVAVPAAYLVDTKTLEVKAGFFGKIDAEEVLQAARQLPEGEA